VSGIRCWDVYVVWRTATQDKMFIALYPREISEYGQKQAKWTGFYISTEPRGMAADYKCNVPIHQHSHKFLRYDSMINVGEVVEHYAGELQERVGFIENGTCERVLMAMDECGLLERRVEVQILSAARSARVTSG